MKTFFVTIAANLVALAFAIGGIILAIDGKEGWGWCFFLALLTTHSVSSKKDGEEIETRS